MAARSKARKRALDVLFEADQRGLDAVAVLRERLPAADPPVPSGELVLPPPAVAPPRPRVEAEPLPEPPLPAAEPPVPSVELVLPPPAVEPPMPAVEDEDCA